MTNEEFDIYYEEFLSEQRYYITRKLTNEYRSAASDFCYLIWNRFDAPLWSTVPMFLALGLVCSDYNGLTTIICAVVLIIGILYTFFFGKGNIEDRICDFFFYRFRYEQILIDFVEFKRSIYLSEHKTEKCREEANYFFDRCVRRIKDEGFEYRN